MSLEFAKVTNERFNGLRSSSTASLNAMSSYATTNGSGGGAHHGDTLLSSTILNHNNSLVTTTATANGNGNSAHSAALINGSGGKQLQLNGGSRHSSNNHMQGILQWKAPDESRLLNKLVDELKPRLAATFLPGLPAYVLFMCIRYADVTNDDDLVRSLLSSTVKSIKSLIKVRSTIYSTNYFVDLCSSYCYCCCCC